jgi:antitoxin ParD1/3/4
MAAKTSISLTDELDAYVRSLIASGRYASVSAVLQRGLEMLREEEEVCGAHTAVLRGLIRQRRAEPSVPLEGVDDFMAAVERHGRQSRQRNGGR